MTTADTSLQKIWWLASYPKSGNTWVRQLVNSYVTETPIDINHSYKQYCQIDNQVVPMQAVSAKEVSKLHPVEAIYNRLAMLNHMIAHAEPAHLALKTHFTNADLDKVPLIPPRLTRAAVYLVRDPRDVVLSLQRHNNHKDVEQTIQLMQTPSYLGVRETGIKDYIGDWSTHVISWQKTTFPTIVVRYEDLVAEPLKWFTRILQGLGLGDDLDETKLNWAIDQASFANLRKQEQDNGFCEAKGGTFFGDEFATNDPQSRIGQWRKRLTPNQVYRIEQAHHKAMKLFGYEPEAMNL